MGFGQAIGDALPECSSRPRAAAPQLGFGFEGRYRLAVIHRGRSCGAASHAVLGREWPVLEQAFVAWLAPANFDADGRQRRSLAEVRAAPH